MGIYFKGNSVTHHSLLDNLKRTAESFSLNDEGYFGEIGKSNSPWIREIKSDDVVKTALSFYDLIGFGGIERELKNGKGLISELKDGTCIVYRENTSTPNSPAVEINIRKSKNHGKIKYQKIHFERK